MGDSEERVLTAVADALGRPLAPARFVGPRDVLPSPFDVTTLAAGSIAAASSAVAALYGVRTGATTPDVIVNRRAAAAAFGAESLFTPSGWTLPPVWDPLAGNYRTRDGWIRLHTNYRHHRQAVSRVLAGATTREAVAAAVASAPAEDLETAVVAAGGCAAALRTAGEWAVTPAGTAAAGEPLIRYQARAATEPGLGPSATSAAPLAGIRVLDLTRVIAGPVCTRFLAAYGADVLRIDPPGFEEVPALLAQMTAGKRCAALDLTRAGDRAVFEQLARGADVLVSGLRADALAGLGYGADEIWALNPSLVVASLNAYGWTGPWRDRRGFDSLVQLSCGLAAPPSGRADDPPVPLPAQALDHATGYFCAAAVIAALTDRIRTGATADIRCSLIATAGLLQRLPRRSGTTTPPEWTAADTAPVETAWGAARGAPIPAAVAGLSPRLDLPAGPLGRDAAGWSA
jgi:CoA-transferase family III